MYKIPLYKAYITKDEINAVLRVLKRGKLARGDEVNLFEREFADYVGKKYAVAVNSGTSGLHVAVRAMGWKKGDEVITTPFSYVASGNCLLYEGVKPVMADINPETLNLDLDDVERRVTKKTKGILAVHVLGLPVDTGIREIASRHGLEIIEDACETIGRPNKEFLVGSLGKATVYGFHENKQMTAGGEGGMIVTDDKMFADKCRAIRDQGRASGRHWIKKVTLGYNFRMTEMQAAFGRSQLVKLDRIIGKRAGLAKRYDENLKGQKGFTLPLNSRKRSWFLYFVVFASRKQRSRICKVLERKGIAFSTSYFPPIHKFPMYRTVGANCPVAESVSERLLALPMYFEMTNREVDAVSSAIKVAIKL